MTKAWVEPTITINGTTLTVAEALVIRVAVSSFLTQLADPEYCDQLGPIAEHYKFHLSAVAKIIHEG